jgi:hypothetical protein
MISTLMHKIKDVNKGDILTFKAADNRYKVLLCTSTYKEKSPQNYTFAALTYDSIEKPTMESLRDSEFYGVGNRKDDYFKYTEVELEKMWRVHPDTKPYYVGSYGLIIWRKDFMKFRDNLELIGNLNIIDNLDKNGNGGMNASDWNFLREFFSERYKTALPDRGQKPFKVEAIVLDN